MGRSVSVVPGATVAYQQIGFLDYDEFEWFIEDVQETLKSYWPSFRNEEGWIGRENRIVAGNAFATVTVSEYGGIVAICLVSKAEYWRKHGYGEDAALEGLSIGWCGAIEKKFLELFGRMRKVGTMSNGVSYYYKEENHV